MEMALLFMLILVLFGHTRTRAQFCETTSCGGVSIEFPFSLKEANQSRRCGYPGFELSCNSRRQPLLSLPNSGEFVVTSISLENQRVWINDPKECLPRRILSGISPAAADSPFQFGDLYNLVNYSFLNCPSNVTDSYPIQPISCLSTGNNQNQSVLAVLSNPPFLMPWTSSCELISSALVPVVNTRLFWTNYYADIQLQWNDPNCGNCESRGGRCGFFLGTAAPSIACYDLPPQAPSLSRKAKYGIALGLGIPGFVGVIGLACIFWGKMKMQDQRRQASTEFSTSIIPHPAVIVMGLDGATIEKYPKTQIGDSGRLPKPNDNICSICLCEYQPKETLRTIPDCNHYFHANCIDGWLKMNATCPLCRKLPETPSFVTSDLPISPTSTSL